MILDLHPLRGRVEVATAELPGSACGSVSATFGSADCGTRWKGLPPKTYTVAQPRGAASSWFGCHSPAKRDKTRRMPASARLEDDDAHQEPPFQPHLHPGPPERRPASHQLLPGRREAHARRRGAGTAQALHRLGGGPVHAQAINLRRKRSASDGVPELALSYERELLFRIVWVPWPSEHYGHDGRWHVRRHPEATWWQDKPATRRGRKR
jgi:hypothetical protein